MRAISEGATDAAKRFLFERLAAHHLVLATEVERAIANQQALASGIDRSVLSRHLATTDRHIAEGNRHIAEQEEAIEQLKRQGSGSAQAARVLQVLKETQVVHVQNRARILSELREMDDPNSDEQAPPGPPSDAAPSGPLSS